MSRRAALVALTIAGCGHAISERAAHPPREQAEQAQTQRPGRDATTIEYVTCEALGVQRFDRAFCVHAEDVRVEDLPVDLCPNVTIDPSAQLFQALDEQIRQGIATTGSLPRDEIEIVSGEGLQAIVTLDACVRQPHVWSQEERSGDAAVVGSIDPSRPLHVRLVAARGISYRVRGANEVRAAEVGAWPHRTAAPAVEWVGNPTCAELPESFWVSPVCMHAEHVRGGIRPFALCDRVVVEPSDRLRDRIEWRIVEHLAIGEHDEERIIDVELDERAGYELTLDACVAVPQIDSQRQGLRRVRGRIDASRPIRVEIERAHFRFRYGAEGPFQDAQIGAAEVPREDQAHE